MTLQLGARLGPYEILAPLGAGGMGEVYRARDPRIGRDVAIKVLPASMAGDADRLQRFEQEARAVGALNHPNILSIHDIGSHEESPYIVTELLEGDTLRTRLEASHLPLKKTVDYAAQICHGLAAAHEKGIVHRDLKPENLFITNDGRVKILDFGLAKLTKPEASGTALDDLPTRGYSESGVILGTVGYMSPEQVRGEQADARSDIFSLGAILYEMLSGRRAFGGATSVERMNAILKEDPPELPGGPRSVPPRLDRVVRRCLEKRAAERFRSALDLAFALEGAADVTAPVAPLPAARRRLVLVFGGLATLLVVLVAGLTIGERMGRMHTAAPPSFHQLTFRRGTIWSARFAPDGQTIIYGAQWEGRPVELFMTRPESPESRPLGFPGAEILAISSTGELAISLDRRYLGAWRHTGTLARMPLTGGAPRVVLADVNQADWSPDGTQLAVVHEVSGKERLEYPIGAVLYETGGWISHLRISPNGEMLAFLDHPERGDDRGSVAVVDRAGKKRTLTEVWATEQGLAWSPHGDEIWFTAHDTGAVRLLRAVNLSGAPRILARVPGGSLTLLDVSRDGHVLLGRETLGAGMLGLPPGETKERELAWLDWSVARDLSADARRVLLTEAGEADTGPEYAIYLRETDGSPAVHLGDGSAMALSPDGQFVLSVLHSARTELVLLPTGAGQPKRISLGSIEANQATASWFPDGQRVVFFGNEPGKGNRIYVVGVNGGTPRPISPEGVNTTGYGTHTLSPDGRFVAALGPDRKAYLYPVDGGDPKPIPDLAEGEAPMQWSGDGSALYVLRRDELPAKVFKLFVSTGKRGRWRDIMPADPAGIPAIDTLLVTPDGASYVYGYHRILSELYLVEGLR